MLLFFYFFNDVKLTMPHPAFVWVDTRQGYIQTTNQEKAR